MDAYCKGGLDGLRHSSVRKAVSELAAFRDIIRASFEAAPVCTIAEACDRIEKLTGIRRSPTQVRKFLKGLGLKWQRIRAIPVPPKKLGRARSRPSRVSRHQAETGTGRRCSRSGSRVLRGRRSLCIRHVSLLPVVIHADLHPRCLGSSTVQRLGSVERGDAPTDHCDQHHSCQHRDDCELLRKIAALGLTGPITLVLDMPAINTTPPSRRWRHSWGSRRCSSPRTRQT